MQFLKVQFSEIRFYLKEYFKRKKYIYKIDYNDLNDVYTTKVITLAMNGLKTVFTCKLQELIHDAVLLNHINPRETNIIGIIVGKLLYNNKLLITNHPKITNFDILNIYQKGDRYKFQYEISRSGILCYLDTITGQEIIKDSIELSNDKDNLINFSSIQSFYIGVCAGLLHAKRSKNTISSKTIKPHNKLKLVYSRSNISMLTDNKPLLSSNN